MAMRPASCGGGSVGSSGAAAIDPPSITAYRFHGATRQRRGGHRRLVPLVCSLLPTPGESNRRVTMSELKEKVALITGSSRGIGAAIARLFAASGAKVTRHGRDAIAMAAVYADIERHGDIALKVVADVTKFDQIEKMRQQIEDTFGPIDILVTNAGGSFTPPGPLEEITEEGWHASVDGNLTATFLTIKSFLPGMKE